MTLLIEYADPVERAARLKVLKGIEDRCFAEVAGHARVYAIADEDLERDNDEKTSAVHFVRFEFPAQTRGTLKNSTRVILGCDHPNYTFSTEIEAETLLSLTSDLR